MANMYTAGITTGFQQLAADFRAPFSKLTDIVAWPVFAQGAANLIWMPVALCIGKRPVALFTMAMLFFGSIWAAKASTLDELLGARVFACLGSGSAESLGPAIIADMFLERHFATAMAIYALTINAGSQMGPLIGGYLIQDQGWRWFFWLNAILAGASFVLAIFFMPETSFARVYYEGETMADVDKETLEAVQEDEKKVVTAEDQDVNPTAVGPRQRLVGYGDDYWKDLFRFKLSNVDYHGPKFGAYQFSLPFLFLLIPGALFASASYGLALGWNVVISIISPQIFGPPPYNFSSSAVGLFGMASFIGTIITFPIAGPLTDLLSKKIGERQGRHEPEWRLPALIAPFILCPVGLIVFGQTYIPLSEYLSHLPPHHYTRPYVKPAIGYALATSGLVLIPSVMLSYVVDSYPATSGEALVLINATKNFIAFGVTKGSSNWLASAGVRKMFMSMAGIMWALLILAVPLFIWGKWIREKTSWALKRRI